MKAGGSPRRPRRELQGRARWETPSGPVSGSIKHDPDDGLIDTYRTFTSMADGIIEARFSNPYSAQVGDWSSGFLFRQGASNEFHAILVNESGRWYHHLRTGDVDSTQRLADRTSRYISTSPYSNNHIRIITLGAEGWLFINGTYVDKLDLSGRLEAGSVSAIGSYFAGDGNRRQVHSILQLHRPYAPDDVFHHTPYPADVPPPQRRHRPRSRRWPH